MPFLISFKSSFSILFCISSYLLAIIAFFIIYRDNPYLLISYLVRNWFKVAIEEANSGQKIYSFRGGKVME